MAYTPKAHDPLPPLTPAQRIILKDALDRIRPIQNWTQGSDAWTAEGEAVNPTNNKATCWCAMGTIRKSTNADHFLTNQFITRLNLVIEHHLDDDRRQVQSLNDDLIASTDLPSHLRDLTPHQRVIFIFEEALK